MLEAADHIGGRVRTDRVGEYLVDAGPDAATQGYSGWLDMVAAAGMSANVVKTSPVLGMVRDGRIIDVDPTRPARAAVTPALSWKGKLRLGAGVARLWREIASIDAYELVGEAGRDDPTTSAYDFALRIFGREIADYVIDPAMRLVSGSGAREASWLGALGALGALAAWSVPTVNVVGGLQEVVRRAASTVGDVRLQTTVESVEQSPSGVSVRFRATDGTIETIDADACIIATMYDQSREIWAELETLAPDFGPGLRHIGLISITLGYTRTPDSDAYIVAVPTKELPDTLLMFLQHNKAPDRAPAGHGLITLYTDSLATPRYLGRTDEELAQWGSEIIERLCPELRGRQDMSHVVRWPQGGYLADPGFWCRAGELREALSTKSRIALAGDLFGAGSMESAVQWGERAADRLLADPEIARGAAVRRADVSSS